MPNLDRTRAAITQWTPGIKPTWTVSEVRSALRMHADGDFSLSAQLADTMQEDDAIPGLLEKRVGGVLGSAFSLQPVEAPNRQLSQRLVAKYGPLWWDTFPESELQDFLSWRRLLGVGPGVLDWDRGGNEWRARFRCLHPQFLRFDQFNRKWLYQAREGELEVTPGDGRWILLTDGQRGWMRCAVRSQAITWIGKQHTIRDWNRYNERHGLPIIKAMAPAIADDDDTDQFFEDVRELGSELVATLPTHLDEDGAKFDLELLEAKDQSWQTFQAHLDRCDRRFTIYFLGANIGTEVNKEGARATADAHRGVEREKAKVDAENLSTELRRQGLYPLIGFNVAGAGIESIPWPKWNTDPPDDDDAQAKSKETFGKALVELGNAGYEVQNLDELQERYGLKLVKREPPTPPKPSVSPNEGNDAPTQTAHRRRPGLQLLSGASAQENAGFLSGQLYADALVESAAAASKPTIDETIKAIREELDAAEDYEDLRKRLRARYEEMSPEELNSIVFAAMALADLAGRAAVQEDV